MRSINNYIKTRYFSILLAGIVIALGIYFRVYPAIQNLDRVNNALYRQVALINLQKLIIGSVERSSPWLPEQAKISAAAKQFQELIKNDTGQIDIAAKKVRAANANNKPFTFHLLESDPYYYLYLTENIARTGRLSSIIKDGKYFDPFMMAPGGHWRAFEIHPYIGFLTYKALSLVSFGRISLLMAVSALPLILFALTVILFFMAMAHMGIARVPSFIGCVFFALSPIYIQRSSFGWYDTDPYNIMFVLLTLILFTAISGKDHIPVKTSFFLALSAAFYSMLWQGWILLPVLTSLLFFIGFSASSGDRESRLKFTVSFSIYAVSLAALSALFLTPRGLADSLKDIKDIFSGFLFMDSNLWPDILLSVGELKSPSLLKILYVLGGFIFFPLSLAGALLMLLTKPGKYSACPRGIASVYIVTLLMALNAQRFILFLLPVASACFAYFLDVLVKGLGLLARSAIKNVRLASISVNALILPAVLLPVVTGHLSASIQNPLYNSVWDRSLNKIKEFTPTSSIINTWWPPGHFIKAIAHRAVTFDGATINTPQAYWLARAFLSPDEQYSMGVLKMLNTSGNRPAELLLSNMVPLDMTIELLNRLILTPPSKAKELLSGYVDNDTAEKITGMLNASPPPSYFFIYDELATNVLGLYYVMNWDFQKAMKIDRKRQEELKKGVLFFRGSKNNIETIWSISGGMPYIGTESGLSEKKGAVYRFENGVLLNTDLKDIYINNLENMLSGTPEYLLYLDADGKFIEKHFQNSNLKLSVMITGKISGPKGCLVGPTGVIRSVLYKMYYFEGAGLKHFKPVFREESPLVPTKAALFKIEWPGEKPR
ncbi:MAG: hypothetical protein HQL30_07300 [Candidatus Omnitrophica bacterium]|nr:hypothetical protein [Candidatus Omnitrophota bacterium]